MAAALAWRLARVWTLAPEWMSARVSAWPLAAQASAMESPSELGWPSVG